MSGQCLTSKKGVSTKRTSHLSIDIFYDKNIRIQIAAAVVSHVTLKIDILKLIRFKRRLH